jgi:threonine synthase
VRTEGIWTEQAGGTTLAATIKLIQSGRIPRDDSIGVSITGNGLKTTEVVMDHRTPPASIPARLEAFTAVVSGRAAEPGRVAV